MTRLAAYLVRLFSADALALLAIAFVLLFLAQVGRTFDLVTVKGQDLLTLLSQTMLSMPTLVVAFAYVCIGIGLARGLRSLRLSHELQVIHASRRTRSLFGAIATYALLGTAFVMVLTHLVVPVTMRAYEARQSDIAAELLTHTLTPNKFIEMAPGVTLVIGSRGANGKIGDFFADDRRDAGRRTFIAESASLAADENGFVIKLQNGSIQYMSDSARYSEIEFASYDLAIDRLARRADSVGAGNVPTPTLVAQLMAGDAPHNAMKAITDRFRSALPVLAMCLLVTAIAAFPTGRRRDPWLPLEVVVIFAALSELVFNSLPPLPISWHWAVIIGSLVTILLRLRVVPLTMPRPAQ